MFVTQRLVRARACGKNLLFPIIYVIYLFFFTLEILNRVRTDWQVVRSYICVLIVYGAIPLLSSFTIGIFGLGLKPMRKDATGCQMCHKEDLLRNCSREKTATEE